MATISITIPNGLAEDVRKTLVRMYGAAVVGMTVRQMVVFHLKTTLRPHLVAMKQSGVDNSEMEAARVLADDALAAVAMAYVTATQDAAVVAEAAIEGVS